MGEDREAETPEVLVRLCQTRGELTLEDRSVEEGQDNCKSMVWIG